jgi:hypothetical protein
MKIKTTVFFGFLSFSTVTFSAELEYSILPIGDASAYHSLTVADINESRQIIGTYQTCSDCPQKGYISSEIDGLREIEDIGENTNPLSINNLGIVVGSGSEGAFVAKSTESGWVIKNIVPGFLSSIAYDINDSNQITGQYTVSRQFPSADVKAFVGTYLEDDWQMELIPTPNVWSTGLRTNAGLGINTAGNILMSSANSAVTARGVGGRGTSFATESNTGWSLTKLEGLEGGDSNFIGSSAMNNTNQIVGSASAAGSRYQSNIWHAYLATQNDDNTWKMVDLGTTPRGKHSLATDINDAGLIVGHERWTEGDSNTIYDAVIFDYERKIHSLISLVTTGLEGWSNLTEAKAINNKGQIVGTGTYNGKKTSFILTPLSDATPPTQTPPSSDVPVCEVGADPQIIKDGEGTALWWWSDNVVSASIIGHNIDGNPHGRVRDLALPSDYSWLPARHGNRTTTYTMTAIGVNGVKTTCETTVVVEPGIPSPICEIGADPQVINKGEGSALWWWSQNLVSATINKGKPISIPSDYNWFYPSETATYTMNAIGEDGTMTECSTIITVK